MSASNGKENLEEIKVLEFHMVSLPEEEVFVERDVVYENVEALAQIPKSAEFALEEKGREAVAVCQAEAAEAIAVRWRDDFSFPVTFHGCDAGICQLGDVLIPYEEEKPDLDGQEAQLLHMIGAPEDAYRVTDIFWNGEIYTDEAGVICRDAYAVGSKLVKDIQVHYEGAAVFPECERWQVTAEYGLSLPEISKMNESAVVAVSVIAEEAASDHRLEFWKHVIAAMTAAISLLLFLVILVIFLVKRRKMRYTRHDCKTSTHYDE